MLDASLGFLQTNVAEDNLLVQIECFDPHEPYFSYQDYKKHYEHGYTGPHFDWPDYKLVDDAPDVASTPGTSMPRC